MICNLFDEGLIVNGQLTALANPDGKCKTPECPHKAFGIHPHRLQAPAVPVVDFATQLRQHKCSTLDDALNSDLPFAIPLSNFYPLQGFTSKFSLGKTAVDEHVLIWLKHELIGGSEMAVTSMDTCWLAVIQYLCNAEIYRDECHESSAVRVRSDSTICVNKAFVLKHVAKTNQSVLTQAENELKDQMFADALRLFPIGSTSIVCITTSDTSLRLYRLCRDEQTFNLHLMRCYAVNHIHGRIDFIIDIVKLCRWFVGVTGPNSEFHLIPNVRMQTPNNHYVTWCSQGIHKEFQIRQRNGNIDESLSKEVTEHIHRVHSLKLPNVEWGHPVSSNAASVMITRVGRRVKSELNSRRLNVDQVLAGVRAGLNQLHDAGFSHCDINNIVVDGDVVFLDDLEYLTPIDSPPPQLARITGTVIPATAFDLDEIQYQALETELIPYKRI